MIAYLYTSENSETLAVTTIKKYTSTFKKLQPSLRGALEYKLSIEESELPNLIAAIEDSVPNTWIQNERKGDYGDAVTNIGAPLIYNSGNVSYNAAFLFALFTVPPKKRWVLRVHETSIIDADDRLCQIVVQDLLGQLIAIDDFAATKSRAKVLDTSVLLEEGWYIGVYICTYNPGGMNIVKSTIMVDEVLK